ncbi:MAG TPA: hypothetical protein VKU84_16670 [Stellaceae bacterium]|nr:hypothetical protein [Stellaceae bacterium]
MDRKQEDRLELTLRGFSPEELRACAEKRCACYGLEVKKAEIRPCLVSLGGHVRLYEGRFVAEPSEAA